MVLGGGGICGPTNQKFFPAARRRSSRRSARSASNGKKTPTYVFEDAPWIGVRDEEHPYGFAAFDVDPGTHAGAADPDPRHVLQRVGQPDGEIAPLETFTLSRKRSDC